MTLTITDIQARCAALGHPPGTIDGIMGPKTRKSIAAALKERDASHISDLFHSSGLHRIHLHWTGGGAGIIDLELMHYNEVIDHEGKVHSGKYPVTMQAAYAVGKAASHTLNANSGAIGLAIDCMADAIEQPFSAGSAPMTTSQLKVLTERAAYYCEMFDIPVTRYSVLSHAEIQRILGINQKRKWDICWIPGMQAPDDPILVGDKIREMILEKLKLKTHSSIY
ncbi:N-acetylmuramoyl-L-alanine amidase [Pseudovibrio sp. POLY-S9]|uniref:peptidoglycan-binding domain-containing protein n=1 Tax=Pseudovibrio sp. POLY-S9 TaxID=1576596 RepID=UPI00070EA72C|nr:N-acetylmuramoyl-L-alanine amidase [Pseudovibrio sp. POLY-S9]